MAWHWRLEGGNGEPVSPAGIASDTFPTRSDAESWVGESWRELLEAGVAQVTLFEDEREVTGPMSLSPAD